MPTGCAGDVRVCLLLTMLAARGMRRRSDCLRARADDLSVYLRDHTLGVAAALTIAMAAASLAVWLALATDE